MKKPTTISKESVSEYREFVQRSGDSYDNALAVIGLYKTEVIRRRALA